MPPFDESVCNLFINSCELKNITPEELFRYLITVDDNGCPALRTKSDAGAASGTDYELRSTSYKANTAATGYSIGDFIKRVDVMDITQNPAVLFSTFWFNETTGLALAAAPTQANLDVYTEPVVINDGADAAMGAKADAAAASDTGTYSLISLIKRLLQKFTAGIGLTAGEAHIGAIGGNTEKLSIDVTTSVGAYAANDNIGGIITLTNFLRVSGGTGILQSLQLWALANQKPNLYIDFWDASPSGTYTNDAAQVIAGDHAKHLGFVEIAAADWKDTGVISRTAFTSIGIVLKGNASRNIYMTIQDKTGVTFGSVAGLFIKASILQD